MGFLGAAALVLVAVAVRAADAAPATTTTATTPTTTPSPPPPPATLPRLGRFDPCTPPGGAVKGRGFYVGVAFWPGGPPGDWGPATGAGAGADAPSAALLPCRLLPVTPAGFNGSGAGDRPFLAKASTAAGGGYAAFQVKVDTVAALTFNASEMRALFAAVPPSAPPIVTAVLFRGAIRSAPRVVASTEPDVTGGGTGAVEALAAEAVFTKGALIGLRWADLGCDACGGRGAPRCVSYTPRPPSTPALAPDGGPQPQRSCAVVEADCAAAVEAGSRNGAECGGFTLYLASSGTDKDGTALASGAQVRHLSSLSLTRLFDAIRGTVRSVLAGAGAGFVGDGGGGGGSGGGLELPSEGGA